jgi:transformation/transcription domain-associated protein
VKCFQVVIIPLIESLIESENLHLLSDAVMSHFFNSILELRAADIFIDELHVQFIKYICLLVEHLPARVSFYSQKVFAYLLHLLQKNNYESKVHSYSVVAHCSKFLQPAIDVSMEVFKQLINNTDTESFPLFAESLELYFSYYENNPNLDHSIWITALRNRLDDESRNINRILHLWSVLSVHETALFGYSQLFLPLIVNALELLSISSIKTLRHKETFLQVAGMLLSWIEKLGVVSNLKLCNILYASLVQFSLAFSELFQKHPHLNEKNMQLLHKLMHIASTSIESPLFFCPDAVSSFQIGRTGFSDWCSRLLRIIHILNEFKIVSTSEHVLQLFQLLSELYFASNVPIIVHQILEVFEGFLRQNGSNNAFFNTLYERAFSIIASIRPQDYKILHVQLVLVCTLPCMKSLVQENFSNFIYFLKELSKTSEAAEAKNLLGSVNRGSNVAFECANASEINRIIYFEDYCGFILSNSKHKDLKLLILDHLKAFYTSNIKFVVIALKTFSTFLASQDFFSEEDDIYFGFAVDLIRTICIAKIESLANFDQIALIFYFGISCRGISKRAEFIQLLSLFERSYLRKMLLFVMAYLPSKTRVSKWASRSLFLLFSAVAKNACIKSIAGSAFLAHGFKEYSNFSPLNFRYRCKIILNMSLSSLMSEVSLKSSESFMSYLGEICTYMPQVSSEIWKNVFSYVWSLTGDVERRDVFEKLQKSLKSLSGECKYENFNGIQTLMGALSKCSHSEMFDPMLIVSLSSKFNCWFSGIDLLHEYLQMDPENARVANALRTLYNLINEEDIAVGLWNSVSFASPISQAALALEQFRLWQRSKEVLMKGLCRFSNDLGDDQKKLLDYQLFENEWIRCEKAVNSWETLLKFGLDVENPEMQFEAAVKLSKWDIVKENIPKICLNEYSSIETPCKIEIAKLYMHILERNSGSDDGCFDAKFEDLCNLCIEQWIKLPSCISAIHVPMLAFMQQLAELKESNQVLSILPHSSNSSNHRSSDLDFSNLISCWRERVPNTWEDLPIWIDVLGWRLDFFKNICERLNLDDTSPRYTQLHDIPWTIVKLAQVSRKQLLSGTSIDILGTVTDSKTLDSRDTYFKLRELIKVVSQLTTVSETRLALQIIQMINLDYFSNSQKAELFRLKGEALQILGFGDESHAAFSAATSMNDCDGKSWNSWGSFCDRVFSMRKETQWAEYAVSCYLQAVAYGNPRARLMLTRVLWLLSFDEPNGSVIKAFEKYSSKVPLWVWLLWLPQLLSSLGRNEGPQIQLLLAELLKLYPQVVYYSLRGYILEKSELNQAAAAAAASRTASNSAVGSQVGRTYVLTSSGINSTSYMQSRSQSVSMESSVDGATPNNPGVSKSDAKSGLKLAEELVKLIQSLFTSLTLEVSKMIDEITKKLKPDSEEDLLSAVSALFIRSFKQPVSSPDEVPKPTIQTLERVYTKFFSSSVPANTSDQKEFIMKYKNDFENDFLPSSSAFPAHLTELMRRLKKWKSRLQYSMKSKGRECLKLEKLSNYLSNFQSCDIEIPGQYFTDQEPSFNTGVLIHSFDSDVPVYRHHGFSSRRLAIRGNDGNLYYFFVHLSLQHLMRSEERMMQLHTIINRLLLKYNESQRRNLFMHVRKTIPLSHRLRLVQIDPTEVTMEEVYIHCCSKNGVDADAPLTMYRNHIGAAISWERNKIARLEVFEKILNRLLPPSAFSKYMSGTIPSLEEYWLFRKHFASQLALNSFLGYIMKVGDRLPYKISFSRSSGHIVFSEFYPSYNAAYLAELAEDVPFRLTPSITTFLSPQIVQGVFGTTLLALAACLLKHQDILKNYMYLFFRDDIISFNSSNLMISSDSDQRAFESKLKDKISANTLEVLQKIQSIMPSSDASVDTEPVRKINHKVEKLINEAMNPSNLALMNPVWHPWF